MDQTPKTAGADWVNAALFGGNWNNSSNSGSRSSNWYYAASNSNNNIGSRFACYDTRFNRSGVTPVRQADQSTCGQPTPSSFGKYIARSGRALSSETSNGAASILMPKKQRNLIDRITSLDNLRDAYHKTAKGKRLTWGYLEFKEFAEANLLAIRDELQDGAYKIGEYRTFTIYEPKARLISALDFKDRLVQHALCNVISPIMEATLLPYTFACRPGYGTHAGVRHVQAMLRSTNAGYFLKTDFSKFFPSIPRQTACEMYARKIGCAKTLGIINEIIIPEGRGVPIGSLTSQLTANLVGGVVDRFIHFDLGYRHWARYMDDIVIVSNDLPRLREDFCKIEDFSRERLGLKISHWAAQPVSRGINFLGYRIWPTHKLLRKNSVVRAKRKIKRYTKAGDHESLTKFLASWSGHARWADASNLMTWLNKEYITP